MTFIPGIVGCQAGNQVPPYSTEFLANFNSSIGSWPGTDDLGNSFSGFQPIIASGGVFSSAGSMYHGGYLTSDDFCATDSLAKYDVGDGERFCLEFFVKFNQTISASDNIFSIQPSDLSDSIYLKATSSGLNFEYDGPDGESQNINGSQSLSIGSYIHVSIIGDASSYKTFVDGVLNTSYTFVKPMKSSNYRLDFYFPASGSPLTYRAGDPQYDSIRLVVGSRVYDTSGFTPPSSELTNISS